MLEAKNNRLKRKANNFIFEIIVDNYGAYKNGDIMVVDLTDNDKYITEHNNIFYRVFVSHLRNGNIMKLLEQHRFENGLMIW